MDKTAREMCTSFLEAVGAIVETWGLAWRLELALPENMGASLTIVNEDGVGTAGVDAILTRLGSREYVLINIRCQLVGGLEDERLPQMERWVLRANMMLPLGSVVVLEDSVIMKHGAMLDAALPSQVAALSSSLEVFFIQRLLYQEVASLLAAGAISLEDAIARLG